MIESDDNLSRSELDAIAIIAMSKVIPGMTKAPAIAVASRSYAIARAMLIHRKHNAGRLCAESGIKRIKSTPPVRFAIEGLKLQTRTANCLLNAGVQTIEDLTRFSREDLCRIQGFGVSCMLDLEAALSKTSYQLKS